MSARRYGSASGSNSGADADDITGTTTVGEDTVSVTGRIEAFAGMDDEASCTTLVERWRQHTLNVLKLSFPVQA